MRIGISAPHRASTPRSGVGRYVQGLVGALLRVDRENEYVLITDEPFLPSLPPNARWEIVRTAGRLSRLWFDHVRVRGIAAGLDVLLATKTVLPRRLPCRGVATVHDLAFLRHADQYPLDFRLYWSAVMRGLAESPHHFVCVSQTTAADVRELLGVPDHRVHAVPSGIELDRFTPRERKPGAPYILFVGNLIPRKNLGRMLEAHSRLDVDLVLAGADLMGLPPRPRVRRVGEMNDDALCELYSGAAALAFPSLYEGFGFPILEAMACGCPVVTSDRGSMREIAGDAAVLVDPEDVDSIADGLRRAMSGATREAGFERVRRFSWDEAARATLKVLVDA